MTTSTPARPSQPSRSSGPSRLSRPALALAITVLVVAACAGAAVVALLGPHPGVSDDRTGDPDLIAATEAAGGTATGLRSLSVGRLEPSDNGSDIATAGLGDAGDGAPDPRTAYELGSITKTFTGLLLADGIDRGEVALDDPLARHLPELADTAAGAITLREVATHTSGLPTMPDSSFVGGLWVGATGGDPYRNWTTARVIDAAATAEPAESGEAEYSNFGIALLGAAQARAAGAASWTDLARERLLDPLGMTSTTFGGTPESFAAPHRANGWPATAWDGEGFYPAGTGTRSTVEDMLRYAGAILDGSAPGLAALEPLHRTDETDSTGMTWQIATDPDSGRQTLWHNGGTGGSRTMLTIDRQQRTAAIVLGNSDVWVEGIGFRLVGAEGPQTGVETSQTIIGFGVLALAIGAVGTAIVRIFRGPTLVAQLSSVAGATFMLTLMVRLGPWGFGPWTGLPAAVGGALIGLLGGTLALILWRKATDRTPTLPTKQRWAAGFDLAVNVALAAVGLWILWLTLLPWRI